MNLTKITASAGVAYLLKSVVTRDGAEPTATGAVAYYTHPGTPPGVWAGSGLAAMGLSAGERATREQAERLFSRFRNPVTGDPLGAPSRQLHDARARESPEQVSGFDLTFSIPKSVSVLWGVADAETQAAIMDAHHAAITGALAWFEHEVASTRSGRGGVASASVRGVVAIAYDHFETRDGDPHLHTHLALANRVQRASDGKWLTLDGRAIYRSAVAMSELHENALLDQLHERLGLVFTERERPDSRSSRSVVADVAGFPSDLVDRFSTRRFALRKRREEREAEWLAHHPEDRDVPSTVKAHLDAQAWRETRKPKDAVAAPLSTLTRKWRDQLRASGYDGTELIARVVGHERRPVAAERVRSDVVEQLARLAIAHHRSTGAHVDRRLLAQITDHDVETWLDSHDDDAVRDSLGAAVHDSLTRRRTTWTRFNARAEVERLTRLVRVRPGERQSVIDAITTAALTQCVPITPHRYELPDGAVDDVRLAFGGHTVFDNPNLRLFTSQQILDAEAFLDSLTEHPGPVADAAPAALEGLAEDQASAVGHLMSDPHTLTAVVGPAGTGKTTAMAALHRAWTTAHGAGSVIGVAPSARAAHELSVSVGVDAHTLAMLLIRNSPDAHAQRSARRAELNSALTTSNPRRRAAALRGLAALDTDEASFTLHPGTLVIVDEASMCSTHDLAALGRLAVKAGAKIALVGDPAQLDAIDAGGFLGWLDRRGKTARLTTLFRFDEPWEAAASLRLRDGDTSVLSPSSDDEPPTYADGGRIHDGETMTMLDAAYDATRAALRAGRTAVLIAATNDHVADLNLRTTLDRREAGEVDISRLVTLRGIQDAGVGDLIYTRMNDHGTLRDDTGTPIHNGDLLRITAIADDGAAHCQRVDTGATITLPSSYLAAHCDLGYALTAHRAQGITVDEAHLFIPYGARMTRELLYVAMTRGRVGNTAWVGLPDAEDLAHENRSPWQVDDDGVPQIALPTGVSILAQAMAAVGAEQTAHEQRDAEIAAHTNLGRLVAEHEVLASHAIAPRLTEHLQLVHPDIDFTSSPAWDALVSTFRHAYAVNPTRALRLLAVPPSRGHGDLVQGSLRLWPADPDGVQLTTDAQDAVNPTAITQWRLASALVNPAPIAVDDPAFVAGQVARIETDDEPLADLARQSETLIAERVAHLSRELDEDPPGWTASLPRAPEASVDGDLHDAWHRALLAVAVYRDTWQVTAPSPLGPVPQGDRRQLRHYEQAHEALRHWREPPPAPDLAREPDVDLHADVDWEQLDPGGCFTAPGPEWIPREPITTADDDPDPWHDLHTPPPAPQRPSWKDSARQVAPADEATLDRIGATNTAALAFWTDCATQAGSWVGAYLTERRLTHIHAAHAPAGWTTTRDHLRGLGYDDAKLLEAGLITRASTGRLIDRFRDRIPLPVHDSRGRIAGFTARANPAEITARPDTTKYLNTAATAAYDKGRLVYGLTPDAVARLTAGATPVLVEGPLDCAAIDTLGLEGFVPLATCGTAVTANHLGVLAATGSLERLICAFDRDTAGQRAAASLWTLLGPEAAGTVRQAVWDGAKDPGELVETGRGDVLAAALNEPRSLACAVVDQQFTLAHSLDHMEDQLYLVRVIARQVTPTLALDAITQAQDAIVGKFDDGVLIGHDTIAREFVEALDGLPPIEAPTIETAASGTDIRLFADPVGIRW